MRLWNGLASLVALAILLTPSLSFAIVINEVLVSHTGSDNTEFVEFFGPPGDSLSGLSLLVVEGDSLNHGEIDRRFDFGPEAFIGTNGFFLLGNPNGLLANYGILPNETLFENYFENSSLTIALALTSTIGGTSVTGTEIIVDTVALTDGDAGDTFYFGAPVIGPDGPFFPAGARRTVDGQDTDTIADWVLADFALGSANTPTPGTPIPEPGTILLLGSGLLGLIASKRR